MPKPQGIHASVQLLVEGNGDFFKALAGHTQRGEAVQIQNFGGVSELQDFLSALMREHGFREVHSLGIVRDAETDARAAFQSVQSSLRNNGLGVPSDPGERVDSEPAVSVLILPGNGDPGMLETLLWRSFAGSPEDICLDSFFECLNDSIDQPHKARILAYLATKPHPHGSINVAAQRGHWDLDHSAFGELRDFIRFL